MPGGSEVTTPCPCNRTPNVGWPASGAAPPAEPPSASGGAGAGGVPASAALSVPVLAAGGWRDPPQPQTTSSATFAIHRPMSSSCADDRLSRKNSHGAATRQRGVEREPIGVRASFVEIAGGKWGLFQGRKGARHQPSQAMFLRDADSQVLGGELVDRLLSPRVQCPNEIGRLGRRVTPARPF